MKLIRSMCSLGNRLGTVLRTIRDFCTIHYHGSTIAVTKDLIKTVQSVLKRSDSYWLGTQLTYEHRFEPVLMSIHQRLVDDCLADILRDDPSLTTNFSLLDIGANIGQFGFGMKSRLPASEVISFEPNHTIFHLLRQNATRFENWHVFNAGIHDRAEDKTTLVFVKGRSGQGSVHVTNATVDLLRLGVEVPTNSIEVQMIGPKRLASMFENKVWTLVKVDVEGSEFDVLSAIRELQFKYLLLETGGPSTRVGRVDTLTVDSLLNSELGYDFEVLQHYFERPNDVHGVNNTLLRRCTPIALR